MPTNGDNITVELPHPDKELFDHLNGRLEPQQVRAVEDHLSACADCSSIAAVVQLLKREAERTGSWQEGGIKGPPKGGTTNEGGTSDEATSTGSNPHPDVRDLASFFGGKPDDAANRATAAHVAICKDCEETIGEYARAEEMASRYSPTGTARGQVAQSAWKMIDEWENSSFAKLRPEGELEGRELRDQLLKVLRERGADINEAAHHALKAARGVDTLRDLVPVIVLNRDGEFRGVEVFEKASNQPGVEMLAHVKGSRQFDNSLLHALFDFRSGEQILLSNSVKLGAARIEYSGFSNTGPLAANYFIFAD